MNGRVNILKNGFGGIIEWRCNRNTSTDDLEPIEERSCELTSSGIWVGNSDVTTKLPTFYLSFEDTLAPNQLARKWERNLRHNYNQFIHFKLSIVYANNLPDGQESCPQGCLPRLFHWRGLGTRWELLHSQALPRQSGSSPPVWHTSVQPLEALVASAALTSSLVSAVENALKRINKTL